jgi:hypothetical protein
LKDNPEKNWNIDVKGKINDIETHIKTSDYYRTFEIDASVDAFYVNKFPDFIKNFESVYIKNCIAKQVAPKILKT